MGDLVSTRPIAYKGDTGGISSFPPIPDSLRATYSLEPLIALAAAISIAPVAIAVGLVIAALSRQSPLIRHRRVGWRGEELRLLKFRTMWNRTKKTGPLLAIEDLPESTSFIKHERDHRVTSRFANWCRRYSLDEIPQLFHIIRGEMSFVGPRPITQTELDTYYGCSAAEVLSLRPGLTGLWQTMGRSRLDYSRRRRLDVLLVRRASPRLFGAILLRTIPRVLSGDGAY